MGCYPHMRLVACLGAFLLNVNNPRSDSSASFASVPLDELLAVMEWKFPGRVTPHSGLSSGWIILTP